jgi:Tfp pilus assembly protein PilN
MVRINLLPPEILEKRRYERFFKYVYFAAAIIAVVLIGMWLLLGIQVSGRNRDLQSRQELANKLNAEAEAFAVFEQKQADLDARKAVATTALAGRVNWARVSNEISLVLPSEVWANGITANQDTGVQFALVALDGADSPDVGQKAVAQTMVRLNDLDSLYDVWLKATSKGALQIGESTTPVIDFQLTAQVVKPASANAATAPGVPAPPASGQ